MHRSGAALLLALVLVAAPVAAQPFDDPEEVRSDDWLPGVELEAPRSHPDHPSPAVARGDLLDMIHDLDDGEAVEFWQGLIGDTALANSFLHTESSPPSDPTSPAVARGDLLDMIHDLDDGEAVEFWQGLIGDTALAKFTGWGAPDRQPGLIITHPTGNPV